MNILQTRSNAEAEKKVKEEEVKPKEEPKEEDKDGFKSKVYEVATLVRFGLVNTALPVASLVVGLYYRRDITISDPVSCEPAVRVFVWLMVDAALGFVCVLASLIFKIISKKKKKVRPVSPRAPGDNFAAPSSINYKAGHAPGHVAPTNACNKSSNARSDEVVVAIDVKVEKESETDEVEELKQQVRSATLAQALLVSIAMLAFLVKLCWGAYGYAIYDDQGCSFSDFHPFRVRKYLKFVLVMNLVMFSCFGCCLTVGLPFLWWIDKKTKELRSSSSSQLNRSSINTNV